MAESRFLEAPLVRQADGELKNLCLAPDVKMVKPKKCWKLSINLAPFFGQFLFKTIDVIRSDHL